MYQRSWGTSWADFAIWRKRKNCAWVRNYANILGFPHYTVPKLYLLMPYLEFPKCSNYSLLVDRKASFTSYLYNSGKNSNIVIRK